MNDEIIEEVEAVNETGYDPRAEGLKAQRERRQAELEEEGMVFDDPEEEVINKVEEVVEEVTPAPSRHKIKVNGKELDLSYEELVARAQKIEAADDYLRSAKEIADAIKSQPSTQDAVEEDVDDIELVRAIQMGTEEEAAAALRKLRQPTQPSINQDELFQAFEAKQQLNRASEKFASEFSDVMGDPYLRKLAFEEDARLVAANDTRPIDERFKAVGNTIRTWRDSLTKSTQSDEKLQRKLNVKPVPKAAGRQVQEVEQEEREETRSEMVARMMKSRGQQI